jgi:flagellin
VRINHNLSALNAWKNLTINDGGQNRSLEKLSSGLRIGRAADDAAGLSISEKMRGQISGLNQASRNAQDGISLLQTAEGALQETHSILQRMRELAVQSASDTVTNADRIQIQKEVDALTVEITRIGVTTEFNTQPLLDSSFSNRIIHIGANAGQTLSVSISDMRATSAQLAVTGGTTFDNFAGTRTAGAGSMTLIGKYTGNADGGTFTFGFAANGSNVDATVTQVGGAGGNSGAQTLVGGTGSFTWQGVTFSFEAVTSAAVFSAVSIDNDSFGINVSTQSAANTAITTINTAINNVSGERSKLGAIQNRLEHTIANLSTSAENLTAAESRIRDVDIAVEMMTFTKYQILGQASTAMLAQANAKPQAVLQLLR